MKKKLLSLALVFVMALTLLPTAAFAAEDLGEGLEDGVVCARLEGCVNGQHDPACPKYAAPEPEPEPAPQPEANSVPEPASAPQPEANSAPEVTAAPQPEPKSDPEPASNPEQPVTSAPAAGSSADPVVPGADEETPGTGTGTPQEGTPDGSQDGNQDNDTRAVCAQHTFKAHAEVRATCGAEGTKAYYECETCKKLFLTADVSASDDSAVTSAALVLPKLTTHDWSGKDGTCKVCSLDCDHSGDTSDKDATCSVCGKTIATANDCGHFGARTKVTRGDPNCGNPGYAMTGDEAWYCSECRAYYTSATGNTKADVQQIAATNQHTRQEGSVNSPSVSGHKYTCSVCQKEVSEAHTYGGDNICDFCGFVNSGSTTNPPSYRYLDITSAYVNSYSISVTWYSDLPAGTYFDIYVDSSYRATVAPSKSSSGHFSYTLDYSYYLGDSYYTIAVYARDDHSISDSIRTYNRYYDHDYDYWYDHGYRPNGTPGTNSSGIPYASQVNGRYSASEAIRILRNRNQNTLQYDLLNSSSASSSFYDLEQAVKRANNVSVQVDIDRSDVPSSIRNIQIVGAAFNASSTNSTVRLVVDAPSQGRYTGYGYAFSMSLTGVGSDYSLDVPVKITMPVPSNINAGSVRILHYHNSGAPTVIEPKVSGSSMSFTLTGFSDFVITDNRVDPYYYYYTPGVPASARRNIMQEHLAVVLPILASMPPSGYVFDDVPPTYWAATEIAWARDGGMMTGYFDGTFRPYAATTRQELWMVLARLAGARPADMGAARTWVMNAGISDGRNPHSPLSRQQMISMLYRYAQYLGVDVSAQASLRGYGDSAVISGYARNAMAWAIDQGIIAGDLDGLLHPQDIATRADFAVYLYRFIY